MASKEIIGRVLSTGSTTVSAEHVAQFARALGDPSPLYTDPEAARRGPFGTIVAPPTYPIAFMAQALAGREYRGEWICNYTHKLGAHVDEPKTHLTYGFATQVVILDDDQLFHLERHGPDALPPRNAPNLLGTSTRRITSGRPYQRPSLRAPWTMTSAPACMASRV